MKIRFATPGDGPALRRVYAQYIDTPVTFECTLPTEAEFTGRIAGLSGEYPYLLCEENGQPVGYAYAHRIRDREAYQWGAELSVFLDAGHTSRGLGKKLYRTILAILQQQGVRTAYGCVSLPNAGSEALHKSFGFQLCGTFRCAGYKNGKWRDIVWFEKTIAQYTPEPAPFIPIRELPREELERIVASHQ